MTQRPSAVVPFALPVAFVVAAVVGLALAARARNLLAVVTATAAVDTVVELAVTATGAVIAAWLAWSLLLASVCALARGAGRTWRAGESAVHRWAPRAVRRALVSVVVTGISLGAGGAAHAQPVDPLTLDLGWTATSTVVTSDPSTTPTPLTGPTPDGARRASDPTARPVSASSAIRVPGIGSTIGTPVPERVGGVTHVVQSGDTLWSIAARYAPDGAGAAGIAASWPTWYAANRALIGADPDLIRPGQVLQAPVGVVAPGEPS
jgi:nucleoid-associated protein YgaU